MTVPLDGIRAIHNAFRKDISAIDDAANKAAKGIGDLDAVRMRKAFFNDILLWHATGEEAYIFPALEAVSPLVAEAYELDHRGLDTLSESLDVALKRGDVLEAARVTAAFRFHLDIHLDKEDSHLYRIFNERIPLPQQADLMRKMPQKIPQERFPELVAWLYPLMGSDDRENMTRIWRQALPAPAFESALKLIRAAIGEEWGELARRIPEVRSPT